MPINVPVVQTGFDDAKVAGRPCGAVQVLLNYIGERGADGKPLTVDGQCGANTAHAIASFQKRVGLPATGKTDGLTLARMTLA